MTLTRERFVLTLTIFSLILLPTIGASQNKSKVDEKIKTAAERSKKATEILKQVTALPEDKGIPKNITEKMNLIGVIPNASQLSLLFSKGFKGRGVSSIRQDGDWSLPGFYAFGRANGFDLTGIVYKHFDLIMVVVNADFKSNKDKEKTKPPTDKKDESDKPQSYFYAFAEGVLKPIALKTGFVASMLGAQTSLVYDNNLNKAVYGVKGDDVLLGKIDAADRFLLKSSSFATP